MCMAIALSMSFLKNALMCIKNKGKRVKLTNHDNHAYSNALVYNACLLNAA